MNLVGQRRKSIQANDIIHEQFLVLGKLDNKKHSSKILKGFDKQSKNFVVIKITSAAYREKNKNVTKILQKLAGNTGVPKIIWRGVEGSDTITVTECLGPNLKKLFLLMNKEFSHATIATIAIQILTTLESIHKANYVCCNIMPKEILISLHKKSQVLFITDYKQARKVKAGRGGEQVSSAANKSILNKFSSVNLHLGLPASQKDDLESLGYILIYFFNKGQLFDKGAKVGNKEEKIKYYEQQKLGIIPETICHGLPQQMMLYMTYIKSIQTTFNEKIEYDYLKKLFRGLLGQSNTEIFQYDWMSKARTYNLDRNGNQKQENDTASVLAAKTDLISFNSSKHQDWDDTSDFGGTGRKGLLLSPFFVAMPNNMVEHDFEDVDEFMDSQSKRNTLSVQNIKLFDEKVKAMHTLKRSSLSFDASHLPLNKIHSENDYLDKKIHKNGTQIILKLDDPDGPLRPKTRSVTESGLLSKFGKAHLETKTPKGS